MVAKSETGKQANNSADKPVPSKQDLLDMLVSWCNLALESGLEMEQLFSEEKQRFSLRIHGVAMVENTLVDDLG